MKPDRWNGKGAGVSADSDRYVKLPPDWIIHWADGFHLKFAVGKAVWIWYNQSVIVRFFSAQQGVWRCQEARIINLFLACEGMYKRWPKYFLFAMGVSGQHMNRGQNPWFYWTFSNGHWEFTTYLNLWHFSIAQLLLCRLSLWASAVHCVSGAASTFWKVTGRITRPAMLVCHKVTSQNLIDSGPLFLFTKWFSSVIIIFWLQFLRWFHWLWNLPMLQ